MLQTNLLEINPIDHESDKDKIDFLGNYANPESKIKIFKSTNYIKVAEFLRALSNPIGWEQPIFKDPDLPYYAMTAYLEDKINRQQISHVLEFYELKATYPDIISVPILTSEGKLTSTIEYYFIALKEDVNNRRKDSGLPMVTRDHLEQFRLAIIEYQKKTLPSFCVLYFLPTVANEKGPVFSFLGNGDICKIGFIFFPGSMRNIFYPAIAPKNSTNTISMGTLGKFSIDRIENNIRQNIRLHSLGFPGTFRTTKIHTQNAILTAATTHDGLHQATISYLPTQLYHLVLHCVDIIRKKTGMNWSHELWKLIDMPFVGKGSKLCYKSEKFDPQTTYALNEALSDSHCQRWLITLLKDFVGYPLLDIILYDMTINKSLWQQWLDVENFVKDNISPEFSKALQQRPLTLEQLLQQRDIRKQIVFGFICNWPCIIDSPLGKLIEYHKDSDNRIFLSLFGEAINIYTWWPKKNDAYTDDELIALITDIKNNDLNGINFINAAASGDIEAVANLIESGVPSTPFNYLLLGLKMAAKNGHTDCVQYILDKDMKISESKCGLIYFYQKPTSNNLDNYLDTCSKAYIRYENELYEAKKFSRPLFHPVYGTSFSSEWKLEKIKPLSSLEITLNKVIEMKGMRPNNQLEILSNSDVEDIQLLKDSYPRNSSTFYRYAIENAITAGHTRCVELLLEKITDVASLKTLKSALILSVKHKKLEIIDLLLDQKKYKIEKSLLLEAVTIAILHDDSKTVEKIFSYAKKNKIKLIDKKNIDKILDESPKNCIPLIMKFSVGNQYLSYENLFIAIAKVGSIGCAKAFIEYINTNCTNNAEKNNLIINCMLEGFLKEEHHSYNLHHGLVKLQLDQYLGASAANNDSATNKFPKENDMERLIDKIFSLSNCKLVLHQLIHHQMFIENEDLKAHYLNMMINKALQYENPYPLRLLLRASVALDFSKYDLAVNEIPIKDLPSPEVQCLVWLSRAIFEIQKNLPNNEIIKQCLQNAKTHESFTREVFYLIYNNSIPNKLLVLKDFFQFLGDEVELTEMKALVAERIKSLEENKPFSLKASNYNPAMFHPGSGKQEVPIIVGARRAVPSQVGNHEVPINISNDDAAITNTTPFRAGNTG